MPTTGLSHKERPPYVIFIKGTPSAYRALAKKDPNTLYYITEKGSNFGSLYMGETLICSGSSPGPTSFSLKDLKDVVIQNIQSDSLLVFDGSSWVNKTIDEVFDKKFPNFIGATEDTSGKAGLVPAPLVGQENFYLKGDGNWSKIEALVSKLEHSLTIGDKIFDGSENVNIEVYDGEIKEEILTMQISNMTLVNNSPIIMKMN